MAEGRDDGLDGSDSRIEARLDADANGSVAKVSGSQFRTRKEEGRAVVVALRGKEGGAVAMALHGAVEEERRLVAALLGL